jgi:hypothetical protein
MAILLGFTIDELHMVYDLYLTEKKEHATDLWQLIYFWDRENSHSKPLGVLSLGLKLVNSYQVNHPECSKLIENFLRTKLNGGI